MSFNNYLNKHMKDTKIILSSELTLNDRMLTLTKLSKTRRLKATSINCNNTDEVIRSIDIKLRQDYP